MDPFGFVVLDVVATFIFIMYLGVKVAVARKKYNVPLPDQYTTDPSKKNFNCYQRGYTNVLENIPIFLVFLLLGGQAYPIVAAVFGAVYLFGRVIYALSYFSGDPEKRIRGWPSYIGLFVLVGCTVMYALDKLDVIDI